MPFLPVFIFLALHFLLPMVDKSMSIAAEQESRKKEVELTASLSPTSINVKAGQAINLMATIRNVGVHPLRVFRKPTINQAVMRYNSWICEVKRDGIEYLGWMNWRHTVYPKFPRHRDTKIIRFGKEVHSEFDLQDWYPLESLGIYQVRAVFVQLEIKEVGIHEVPPVYSNWITVIVE